MPRRRRQVVVTKEQIGARLRAIRAAQGMTQHELAEKLDTIQSHVSDMERGIRKPTIQQLLNLSRALRVPVDDILAIDRTAPAPNGSVHDRGLLKRIEKIQKLSRRDRQLLLGTIDRFLRGAS